MKENKTDILSVFDYLYTIKKIAIIFGIFIGLAYIVNYVEAFPEINSISSILSLFIAIAVSFLLIVALFFGFAVSSALLLLIMKKIDKNSDIKYEYLAWNYFIAAILFFIGIALSVNTPSLVDSGIVLVAIFIVVFLSPILSYILNNGIKFNLLQYLKSTTYLIGPLQIFIFSFIAILFLTLYLPAGVVNDFVYYQVIGTWLIFAAIVNSLIIYINNTNNKKEIVLILFSSILVFIIASSLLFNITNKNNIFLIKPFEILKIGHYKETLFFKQDKLYLYKNELLKDTNASNIKLCILSNIGTEYIVQRIILKNYKNQSIKKEVCDINRTYRIDKNNLEGFKYFDNASITRITNNKDDKLNHKAKQ